MSASISITGSTPLSTTTQREPESLLELASSPGWAGDVSGEQRAAVTPLSGASSHNRTGNVNSNVNEALGATAVTSLDSVLLASSSLAAGLSHPLVGGGSHAFREGDESSLRFFLPVYAINLCRFQRGRTKNAFFFFSLFLQIFFFFSLLHSPCSNSRSAWFRTRPSGAKRLS
jgi:hypothetical protein